MPTLAKILDKYPNVYLELLGGIMQGSLAYLTQDFSEKSKKKIKVIYGTPAFDKYPNLIMSQKWDIGIAPLIDDTFNRSKSHIKWMEYTMMGIPTIASKVLPYTENVKHGLLAEPDEWEEKLTYLIENHEERQDMAKRAYEYIKETQQWQQHKEEYLKIVGDIFIKNANK